MIPVLCNCNEGVYHYPFFGYVVEHVGNVGQPWKCPCFTGSSGLSEKGALLVTYEIIPKSRQV